MQRAAATVAGEVGGFTCGVSRAARVTGLPTAYDQASRAVEVGRRVHGGGVTSFFDDLGVDRLLASVGSDKSKILQATIWMASMDDFAEMNAVWDGWVSPGNAPARATGESRLATPDYKVEIICIAAL